MQKLNYKILGLASGDAAEDLDVQFNFVKCEVANLAQRGIGQMQNCKPRTAGSACSGLSIYDLDLKFRPTLKGFIRDLATVAGSIYNGAGNSLLHKFFGYCEN